MAQFPVSGSQMRTFRCAMASYRWANPWVCKAAPGLTGSGRARQGWEFTGVIFLPPMVSTTVYKSHFDTVYLQIVDPCVCIHSKACPHGFVSGGDPRGARPATAEPLRNGVAGSVSGMVRTADTGRSTVRPPDVFPYVSTTIGDYLVKVWDKLSQVDRAAIIQNGTSQASLVVVIFS